MNNTIMCLGLIILLASCRNNDAQRQQAFTAINPLSYTDVIFLGNKDDALVSTYDGSLYKVNKSGNKTLILKIDDEIYNIEYDMQNHIAYLATYQSGVLAVNIKNEQVIKRLPINNKAWIVDLNLSENGRYLSGIDVKSSNHIWDVQKDFNEINISDKFSNNYVRYVSSEGKAYCQTSGKYNVIDLKHDNILGELPISGKLTDIDEKGNIITIVDNKFLFYNASQNKVTYQRKHPYFIYQEMNGDTIHDPYQLKLQDSKFYNDKIYTVGLDKSIRIWEKYSGKLVDEWVANDATISGFDILDTDDLIAISDLKGNVVFRDIE